MNYGKQAVNDGDGDLCPLRYYGKATDLGIFGAPPVTLVLMQV